MLLEREGSLEQLLGACDRARSGRGSVVLVSGEAGIGKTSLLDALRMQLPTEFLALWGSCDALFTPRPLGPIHDMVNALGTEVATLLETAAPTSRLFSAVYAHLERQREPCVLVFEDVHWADHATLDLVKFLGRRISLLNAVLVVSFRHDEVDVSHPLTQVLGDLPTAHTLRMDLQPLSPAAVGELAQAAEYPDANLFEVTAGNPFFVSELIAGHDAARQVGVSAHIPASVKDAVDVRLSRLDSSLCVFLEALSVVPSVVPPDLLLKLFGDSAEALSISCVERNLLVQDASGLRFRHELARLATLARLPLSRRRTVHAQVLEALLEDEANLQFDQLVHHAAGALDGASVLRFAPRAAQIAAGLGAHREAAAHLATALRFVDEAVPTLAAQLYEDWAYEAGLALRLDDEVLEARRHAITLWRALGRDDKVGENLRWLSRLHWYRGEAAEAGRFSDEAVRVLEAMPASLERATAYSLRSQLHMLNDRMDEAVTWAQRALDLAESFGDIEIKLHALNNMGTALVFRNKLEGLPLLQDSLSLAIEYGFHEDAARVYTNLSEYAVEFRNFELAEQVLADGIAFDTKHDLDAWSHYLTGRLALLRMEQGRLRDAETIAQGVVGQERLTLLTRLPALLVLARSRMRLGERDADTLLAQAMQDALATDELQNVVPARFSLVEHAWLTDQFDKAREHANQLLRLGPENMHPWRYGATLVWGQRLGLNVELVDIASVPEPYRLELEGQPETAAQAWQLLGLPYAAGLSELQRTGDLKHRTEGLVNALNLFEPMGAQAAIAKTRALARDLGVEGQLPGVRRGPYQVARNHPLGLTKREQEVLVQIVSGASNKEISQALSRSQRTVEHHVSSVIAKLNVSNRMEVLLRVQNEPWLLPASD